MSVRTEIVAKIKSLGAEVRGGRYHARRGVINWSKFPFDKHPFGISIAFPEEDDTGKFVQATLSLVFMTKMPDHSQPEVDDSALEELREDARWIADKLAETMRTGSTDPLLLDLGRLPTLEIADSETEIQGIAANYVLEY